MMTGHNLLIWFNSATKADLERVRDNMKKAIDDPARDANLRKSAAILADCMNKQIRRFK